MLYALLNLTHKKRGKSTNHRDKFLIMSPLYSTQDLCLVAVFLWNNALLISSFPECIMKERCLQKPKDTILLATNILRHPVYILSCVCTFQC